jgi:hypothetical protein
MLYLVQAKVLTLDNGTFFGLVMPVQCAFILQNCLLVLMLALLI